MYLGFVSGMTSCAGGGGIYMPWPVFIMDACFSVVDLDRRTSWWLSTISNTQALISGRNLNEHLTYLVQTDYDTHN